MWRGARGEPAGPPPRVRRDAAPVPRPRPLPRPGGPRMTAPAPAAAEGRTLEDRNALVLSCVPLAAALVRRLAYPSGGTPPRGLPPFADVLQEAFLALVRAADLYDPSRAKFSTYAHWAVLNRVLGLLRDARAHP